MQMHTGTWGHVGLATPASTSMESSEEAQEMAMLRCRYGKSSIARPKTSLGGFLPNTGKVIFNPNTLQALADIFETNIDKVFA